MTNRLDVGSTVFSLITTDIGNRGAIQPLVSELNEQSHQPPLETLTSQLATSVSPNDVVFVLTGFPIPPTHALETDGPLGAISLSATLTAAFEANVLILTEPTGVPICETAADTYGQPIRTRETWTDTAGNCSIESFPTAHPEAKTRTEALQSLDPKAIIAIEKGGPNRKGVYHNMAGIDVTESMAKFDELLDAFPTTPLFAIGDGGNEFGMGTIETTIREEVPQGAECQCPCNDGIACHIPADILLPATVSNWGAYGVVALLSVMHETPYLHSSDTEEQMLRETAQAGAVDGVKGGTTGYCDGLPPRVHSAMVELLNATITSALP